MPRARWRIVSPDCQTVASVHYCKELCTGFVYQKHVEDGMDVNMDEFVNPRISNTPFLISLRRFPCFIFFYIIAMSLSYIQLGSPMLSDADDRCSQQNYLGPNSVTSIQCIIITGSEHDITQCGMSSFVQFCLTWTIASSFSSHFRTLLLYISVSRTISCNLNFHNVIRVHMISRSFFLLFLV